MDIHGTFICICIQRYDISISMFREVEFPNLLAVTKQPPIPYGWYECCNEGGKTRVFRDPATRCEACQGFYHWNWISGNQQHWHLYLCIDSQNECWMDVFINTRRRRQNARHFADAIFSENIWLLIQISLRFVPKNICVNVSIGFDQITTFEQ